MKCETCKFAPPPDSEGFQDECGYFEEYGKVWKDGSEGCTLNYQTLQKLDDEYTESLGNMGEDMGTEMDFENRGWDMEDAIRNMKHMIGMYPEGLRHTYKRYGTTFYKPYRNYWSGKNKYLVGKVMISSELRWSIYPYDAWRTRDREKAEKIARAVGGIAILFNPVVRQIRVL